jgi:hypothetical protein
MKRQAERAKRVSQSKPRRNWSLITRPLLHEVHMVFAPVDRLFEQLASGWVDSEKGRPVFEDSEGVLYEATPAVRGLVSALNRILLHHKINLDLDPVLKLCNKLDANMPITPEHVNTCKALIDQCRAAYRNMDMYVVKSLVNTELIALELEKTL